MPEEANNVRPHSVDSYRKELKTRWESRAASGEHEVIEQALREFHKIYGPHPDLAEAWEHLGIGIPATPVVTPQTAPLLQDLGPLKGLPGDARFIPVIGKRPTDLNWNSDPAQWLTAEQVTQKRLSEQKWTGSGLMTGSKVGRLVWLDFDGEETSETGEITKSATLDFEHLFMRPVTDLPPCPISISGRPGRFRALMKMPEDSAPYFKGFSIASGEMPTKAFEFLYEKAGGKLFHAVVEGEHPDGQGWFYRWAPGKSPAEVEIPDLPFWVVAGLVRHIANKAVRRQEREESKSETTSSGESPMDLLTPGKQRKLLTQMSDYWPFRGGEVGTGYAGHWDIMRRLVLSLAKGIDDWKLFRQWLTDTAWDMKNDWDGSKGLSSPVNGGELESFAKSLMRSETDGDVVVPWAAAWKLAAENGWKPPAWALPPREIDASSIAIDSAKLIVQLEKGLMEIDLIDSPAQRLAAQQELARTIGKSGKDMAALLQAIEEGEDSCKEVSLAELLLQDSTIRPCIQGLLSKACLTVVASEGGGAKTSLCYRMAAAVATGGLFADKMKAEKGKVLIIQKDETNANAKQKVGMMDLEKLPQEAKDNVKFRFAWHAGMFPELRNWIKELQPALVVMDSLGTLLGGAGASLNDAEVALYLYRLNKIASEFDTAIVMTHHTRKAQQAEKKSKDGEEQVRKRAKISDLYGSSYIVNAASDVWALGLDGGDSDAPVFALQVLKARSGVTQTNDLIHFQGNLDDLSFEFTNFNCLQEAQAMEMLNGTAEQKALGYIKKRTSNNPITAKDLQSQVGVSEVTIKRVVRSLYGKKKTNGVGRRRLTRDELPKELLAGKGALPFGYFFE